MKFNECWLKSMPIAHRGLHNNEFPENSIGAFLNAKKHGFAIELDVQLSADGTIVVFHDTDIHRMTNEEGIITELELCQIKNKKLLRSDFEIPTLDEVLNIIGNDVPILIEIKNNGKVGNLEKQLCIRLEKYQGIYAVQSFNPFSLQFVKKYCPHILRGQLSQSFKHENMNMLKKIVLRNFILNNFSEPHFISFNIDDMPNKHVSSFRKKGLIILSWTIRTDSDIDKAKEYCDNIIFENIDYNIIRQFNSGKGI